MKKYFLFLPMLLGSIILFSTLNSCIQDPIETEIVNNQKDIISFIKDDYLKDKNMVLGKNIEWDLARTYENEHKIILITVPIKNKTNNIIEELTFRLDNNKISGHLWAFETAESFDLPDYQLTAHRIIEKMTGTVSYIALEGSMRYKYQVVRGKIINDTSKSGTGVIDSPTCNVCHAATIPGVVIPSNPNPDPNPGNPQVPIPGIGIIEPTNPSNPQQDPCVKAKPGSEKATGDAKNQKFKDAKQAVLNSYSQNSQNPQEFGVGFGSNTANGPMDATGVQALGANQGSIQNPFNYPYADIHNHPFNTPPSPGDVYSMIMYYNSNNTFGTRYIVTPNGTVYALIISNSVAFDSFMQNNPPLINPPNAPTFPQALTDEYNDVAFDSNTSNQQAYENALAYMLDKLNVGIDLTKMNANGDFKKINVKKNTSNGSNTYTQSSCN